MKKILSGIFLFAWAGLMAQPARNTTDRTMTWLAWYGQVKLDKHFSAALDLQSRYDIGNKGWYQQVIRTSLTASLASGWQLIGGGAFLLLYPNPNGKPPRQELRPWLETGRKFSWKNGFVYPRLRIEQRYLREYAGAALADDFTWSTFRSRFRCDVQRPLRSAAEQYWYLNGGEEIMFNSKSTGMHLFDQNRIYGGFGYRFGASLALQLNYLYVYLRRSRTAFEQQHVIRLSLLQSFDWSKKENN